MLKEAKSFSSFSVSDIEKAKSFYIDKLGLTVSDQPGPLRFTGNGCDFMVYEKPNHQAADFTILNFVVPNLESTIDELNSKGIECLQYDTENMKTNEKGIYEGHHGKIAWIADPAENVIGIIEGM